jgi:hypothetical protein
MTLIYKIRTITVSSDNGSYMLRAITNRSSTFLYNIKALYDNAKMKRSDINIKL